MQNKNTSTALEILALLQNFPSETIIFLDIDDTIITPKLTPFRTPSYN
ncbi:hypothetical protein [Rickettsia endosymbiont of Halotydeus destructor]